LSRGNIGLTKRGTHTDRKVTLPKRTRMMLENFKKAIYGTSFKRFI